MKTDTQLTFDVHESLRHAPGMIANDVQVACANGIVTLTGSVPYFADKHVAESAVRRVAGVQAVADDMVVNPSGEHRYTDTEIAAAVMDALRWHVWVPNHIQATVDSGWVTLTGAVTWDFERNAARHALNFMHGIVGVTNNITVTSDTHARMLS